MKIIAFIMAFLVLALSIMPCADISNAAYESKSKASVAKSNSQKSDPQQDDCSPFCSCACCASLSVNHSIASIAATISYKERTKTAHSPTDIIKVSLPIWQPPQLV